MIGLAWVRIFRHIRSALRDLVFDTDNRAAKCIPPYIKYIDGRSCPDLFSFIVCVHFQNVFPVRRDQVTNLNIFNNLSTMRRFLNESFCQTPPPAINYKGKDKAFARSLPWFEFQVLFS